MYAQIASPVSGRRANAEQVHLLSPSRGLGFQGRVVLHPRQVDPVNRAYSELSDEQLTAAERIVSAFEEAEAAGVASIRVDGRFVDYPVYELARARLRRHAAYRREMPASPS